MVRGYTGGAESKDDLPACNNDNPLIILAGTDMVFTRPKFYKVTHSKSIRGLLTVMPFQPAYEKQDSTCQPQRGPLLHTAISERFEVVVHYVKGAI